VTHSAGRQIDDSFRQEPASSGQWPLGFRKSCTNISGTFILRSWAYDKERETLAAVDCRVMVHPSDQAAERLFTK
jgi:hypothetical protein